MMGITLETINRIKAMAKAGYTCKEMADKLGIPEGVIRNIVNQ